MNNVLEELTKLWYQSEHVKGVRYFLVGSVEYIDLLKEMNDLSNFGYINYNEGKVLFRGVQVIKWPYGTGIKVVEEVHLR